MLQEILQGQFAEFEVSKKLSELYEILFYERPNSSRRALPDVQAIAKAFFKLQDIDVIFLNKPSPLTPSGLEKLTTAQVKKAIAAYISDLNNYDLKNIFNSLR